jgi:hypothetical protein
MQMDNGRTPQAIFYMKIKKAIHFIIIVTHTWTLSTCQHPPWIIWSFGWHVVDFTVHRINWFYNRPWRQLVLAERV